MGLKAAPGAAFFVARRNDRLYDGEPMPYRRPTRYLRLALLWSALLLGGSVIAEQTLRLDDCELVGSGGYSTVSARCGYFRVPEDPTVADGQAVELFVAVVPAQTEDPPPDAFTFLAGGPGQAATGAFVDLQHAFEAIRRDRDVVLVDQRGTGKSGALECPDDQHLIGAAPTEGAVLESVRACLDGIKADPRLYTTSVAVDDLDRVRAALGYEQLNIYGGSYGTRVGLHYLREYPRRVRSLILDGVVPADISLGPGIALAAQRTLDKVFERCAASTECQSRFPDVEEQFDSLAAELLQGARTLRLADPLSGQLRDFTFDYDRFAVTIRLLSYAPESVALMPLLLDEATSKAHLEPLAAQSVMIESSLSSVLSFGMHNSVVCTEDVPFYSDADKDAERLADTYLGASQLRLLQDICAVWPAGKIDPGFKSPVESDLPVLLLSGGADPVTPPSYAERAARTLPNHLHLVGKDMGHILAPVGCLPRLIAEYVGAADTRGLDTSCVEHIEPMPFFTSFAGPQP